MTFAVTKDTDTRQSQELPLGLDRRWGIFQHMNAIRRPLNYRSMNASLPIRCENPTIHVSLRQVSLFIFIWILTYSLWRFDIRTIGQHCCLDFSVTNWKAKGCLKVISLIVCANYCINKNTTTSPYYTGEFVSTVSTFILTISLTKTILFWLEILKIP